MNTGNIQIISFGQFEKEILNDIACTIQTKFELSVSTQESYIDLSKFYDPSRRQYDANKILKNIDEINNSEAFKTIGLFKVDLFIPILTYIFGQAYLNGKTGIVSLYRLKNELYGIEKNDRLVLERFKKVIIHETGHTLGLKHCHTPLCVMISSSYMEDIDLKNADFCTKCMTELSKTKIHF